MNKEIFIRTVNLILLRFFFQHGKPAKKKEIKTGKVSKLLKVLVNDASDTLDEICENLDAHTPGLGDYENIAKHYGYKVFKIKAKFETSPDGPSKALILAMIGEHPRVTVESFARVVEKQARRKDVAILLREFDRK
ncbi:PREDICTED: uncharacterized protein LOC107334826 isoform X1 [Acropora digitifera]|uniref:uncharacterized protein LOC107334826 isoform X1 n=1 Tax=Acropora digitifera TaxID=70779 RepID=UPI00077ABFA8|nr:PREDICTED: uncharacterized protein LOC107334826 isoform X1 [Acropora digitifera]